MGQITLFIISMSQINSCSDFDPLGVLVVPNSHFPSTGSFSALVPQLELRNVASRWFLLSLVRGLNFLLIFWVRNLSPVVLVFHIKTFMLWLNLEQGLRCVFVNGLHDDILNFLAQIELVCNPVFHILKVLGLRLVWRFKRLKPRRVLVESIVLMEFLRWRFVTMDLGLWGLLVQMRVAQIL